MQIPLRCFPSVVSLAMAILVLPSIGGCGRGQQPPPSGRPVAASPDDASQPVSSDSNGGAPHEPEEDSADSQTSSSTSGSTKGNESALSADEGLPRKSPERSEDDQGNPGTGMTQPSSVDVNLSPVDALKALGATIKTNVKGEVIRVDLKETKVADSDLSHLTEMTEIKELNLSMTSITDDGLSNLESLAELKELYLFGTGTTDDGLKHLSGLTQLEVLCLDDTRITDAGLAHLKNMTELKKLHIQSKETITDAGLDLLTELTKLIELRVGGTEVTDEGVNRLKQRLPDCQVAQ